jgi:hypothetical protein
MEFPFSLSPSRKQQLRRTFKKSRFEVKLYHDVAEALH